MRNLKIQTRGTSVSLGIILGVMVEVIVTVLMILLISLLIISERIDISTTRVVRYIIIFIAVCSGSLIGSKGIRGKTLIAHSVIAGMYLFILTAINIIAFDGVFSGLGMSLLMTIIGMALAFFLSTVRGRGKIRYTKRYR